MFPSDPFAQLVNLTEQPFLLPGQGFGYIYFAFRSVTKIGEVTSFLVNKLSSVCIEAIPGITPCELEYCLWCLLAMGEMSIYLPPLLVRQ